jgi:TolB-like protein
LASDLAALKSGARTVRLLPTAAISIACVVLVGLGWEAVGRRLGSATIPSRLLGAVSPGPVNTVNRPPVIAVLPFTNLSAESDSGYFADGLTDEIIRRLAGISGLRVLSATSSFAFRDQPRNLADVAARLGANLVVEGSVLRSSGRLQIEAQLVQIAGGASLWNQRFDRAPRDVFSIHDEIARSIADTLGLTPPAAAQRRDADLEAYDWHLRGRALVDRRGILNAELATELFQRAIARDPGFAPAYAGLANAYAFLSFPDRGIAFEKAYPIMRPAALEALRLDPTLAEAHAAMGWVHAFDRDWVNAEKAFQESIRLNPSLTQAYTSYSISTLQPLGRHAEALRLLDVAAARDPLSLDVLRQIGEEQLFSGQFAEAVETFQRVREVEPDFPFVQTYLARSLILSGSIEEALRLWAPGSIWPVHAYVRTGRRADAERLAADHAAYPYRMAVILTALGDIDRAAAAAEQVAANEPHRLGRLLSEPELTALRAHPRVVPLRKAFNLP